MIIQMSYASIGENPGCETSQPGIFCYVILWKLWGVFELTFLCRLYPI
jgi:hypothetical protein